MFLGLLLLFLIFLGLMMDIILKCDGWYGIKSAQKK